MTFKSRRKDLATECKTFIGKSGATYLVFRSPKEVHVFTEVGARAAAYDCGAGKKPGIPIVARWKEIWNK